MRSSIYHRVLRSATLFVAAASLCLTVSAKEINVDEAMDVAKAFMVGKGTSAAKVNGKSQVKLSLSYTGKGDDQNLLYAFNKSEGNGFVIIAGDDCVENQVLGYSDSGTFDYDNMPKNAKAWIDGYSSMIAAAVKSGQKITSRSAAASDKDSVVVAPLLTTKWGQESPYNNNCPIYDGEKCVTGCVATAMAQVMNYHEWPKTGTGSHSYTWYSDTLSADFSKETFDWDNIADTYDDTSTDEQNAAVAQLMYDCGVAVNMEYGTSSSSACSFSAMYALYKFFGYDDGMEYLFCDDATDYDEWIKKLKDNLDSNYPVLYDGSTSSYATGHSFVIDGYNAKDYFHVNWGFNGDDDGYYLLLDLNGYNSAQGAIFNIKPDNGVLSSNAFSFSLVKTIKMADETSIYLSTSFVPVTVAGADAFEWQCRLLDDNDSVISTYTTFGIDHCVYPEYQSQTIGIDTTMADGNYRLFYYYRNNDSSAWKIMDQISNNNLNIALINKKVSYNIYSVKCLSDTLNTRLYKDEKNAIKIGFVNNSKDDYSFQTRIVMMNDKDSIVYKGGLHHVDIAAGDTTISTWYDMIGVDEGNYTMYLVDASNSPLFYLNKVTITTRQLAVDSFYVYTLNADNSYTVALRPDFRQQLNKVEDGMYQTNDANGVPYHWITGKPLPNPAPNGMYNGKPVTSMAGMFAGCDSVSMLDLSLFCLNPSTIDLTDMFKDCGKITEEGSALCLVDNDSIASILNTASVTGIDTLRMQCTPMNLADYYNYTLLSDSTYRVGLNEDFKDAINHGLSFKKYRTGNPLPNPCPNGKYRRIKVTDMSEMFSDCWYLTNLDVSSFNTSNVTDMKSMFYNCFCLTSLNVSNFNTSNVTDMNSMFYHCSSLTSLDVNSFNTSNVTDMHWMFLECSSLTALDVNSFNTSNVTDMHWMFLECSSLTALDLSNFNTSNVTDMNGMFSCCSGLTALDLSNFNTSNVTDMNGMFSSCSGLTALDLSNFNTSNVTDMRWMFSSCSGLTALDLSNFNTSSVTDMKNMFNGCSGLTALDLSNFNTSNVTDMSWMFFGCSSLTALDLSSFTISSETSIIYMFNSTCSANESGSPIIGYAMDGVSADLFNNNEVTYINLSKLKFNVISTDMKQIRIPATNKNVIYNIDGMKVLVPRRGNVYIRDGKKVAF